MNKINILLVSLLGSLILTGCGCSSQPGSEPSIPTISDPTTDNEPTSNPSTVDPTIPPSSDPTTPSLTNEEKVMEIVSNFDVLNSNGFDYKIEQMYKNSVTNSKNIELRIDENKQSLLASKIEVNKELNEDISGPLYFESTVTSYYKENQIGVYENNSWNWKNASFDDFVKVNISNIDFSKVTLKNESLIEESNVIFSFEISDDESHKLVGFEGVKNIKFEIEVDINHDHLVSMKMSFNQVLTSSVIEFIPYYNKVTIDIPNL